MSNSISSSPLPEIFVGKEVINRRINNYLQLKHPLLSQALSNGGNSREDTRSIWYAKDHVQTWIDEMDLMGADGMRVYLGAYGEEETPAGGQVCLLVVLTRAVSEGTVHEDIILEDEDNFDIRSQTSSRRLARNFNFNTAGKPREYNYGSPCPPLCTGQGPAFPQK